MNPSPVDPAAECWLLRVFGRVQGVGYRAACAQQAGRLGITGWVRNRSDGSVEALLQGDAPSLARMRLWLQRGPSAAAVENLQATRVAAPFSRFDRFEQRPTA